MDKKIAIISGSGKFPFLFAQAAKEKGFHVVSIAIKNNTSLWLRSYVDEVHWFKVSELQRMIDFLKNKEITHVVMAGQIQPRTLFKKDIMQDPEIKKLMLDLKDRRADSVFGAIADKLVNSGLKLLDSTSFLEEYLPKKSVLTKGQIDQNLWEDINFGFKLAKEIARLDIGQTVVVKKKAVVAVESIEGTDATIKRAGYIAKDGCVMVKVSKPHQDMRFDIPVVGLRTVKNLIKIKAKCLAIEADKTLIIDIEKCIKLANRHNLIIAAI